jgi:hypothetical protein
MLSRTRDVDGPRLIYVVCVQYDGMCARVCVCLCVCVCVCVCDVSINTILSTGPLFGSSR